MRRLFESAVWAAAAVATVAACSFSAGTSVSVDKDELAKEISAQLDKQVGHAPESVECPENLKGEVGATTRCTLNDSRRDLRCRRERDQGRGHRRQVRPGGRRQTVVKVRIR